MPEVISDTLAPPARASSLSLLQLPGEIRNAIYRHTLEVHKMRVPLPPVYLQTSMVKRNTVSNILLVCRQIYYEARTLLEREAVVYVPIYHARNYNRTIDPTTESAKFQTAYHALRRFMNVHLHLHQHYNSFAWYAEERRTWTSLMNAVKALTVSSKFLRYDTRQPRRAVIHFSGYYGVILEWIDALVLPLIEVMAQDKSTEWELRFYMVFDERNVSRYVFVRNPGWLNEMRAKFGINLNIVIEIRNGEVPQDSGGFRFTSTVTACSRSWKNTDPE